MDDGQSHHPRRLEQAPGRRNRPPQKRHVIAERSAEPAGFEEIPLHIDDDKTRLGRHQIEGVWLCCDDRRHNPLSPHDGRPVGAGI
jgi:hypothetical protein